MQKGYRMPPTLALVGERDVAMARRDFEEVVRELEKGNERSGGMIMEGAWHNYSIDVPGRFADIVDDWAKSLKISSPAAC